MAKARSPSAQALPLAPGNLPEFTVGELSVALKRTVEGAFERVRVRGELSGSKRHVSGHFYCRLKDADAVLEAVAWRGVFSRLGLNPEDGMEVVATGKITTYPGRSQYQLVIESMELAGEGALLKLIEERRKRLAAEGLFDAARKKPLPLLPAVIGVVTSPTGAVIRDILHRLAERFPRHVLVWPVAVQGEGAAEQIALAIEGFNRLTPGGAVPRPELIIVARGGGSLEDLMAFNEERVVRAAALSAIPLISGVGHETDTTLIDWAADLRAPTPTAAAERAVPVKAELLARILEMGSRAAAASQRLIGEQRIHLTGLARGLGDPVALIQTAMQRLDDRAERLANALPNYVRDRRARLDGAASKLGDPRQLMAAAKAAVELVVHRLSAASHRFLIERRHGFERSAQRLRPQPILLSVRNGRERIGDLAPRLTQGARRELGTLETRLSGLVALLQSFSYERVLERGFALVRDAAGSPVTSAKALKPMDPLTLRFADGEAGVTVSGTAKSPRGRGSRRDGGDQGSLL
ncbi:MAG: exodeoxyribonuclease VII large subunit [Proteobacteria bacterium]|nr:exodeoxyribonuclease VII large subunit [Pseudomonadota bacterium]MBI3497035.1 exodeoxyribonuclease VII large subunit [Pseudomonadota bacterium]